MAQPDLQMPANGDAMDTLAERPVAKALVPENARTPDTRVSVPGVRASMFPKLTANNLREADNTMGRVAAAMRADEIERISMFFKVIVVVVSGCLLSLPFIEGNPWAKWMFAGGLLSYVVAMLGFVLMIRRDSCAYRERNFWLPGATGVLAGYAGVYFWGAFSPAPAIIVMALYFNSLIGSFRYTAVVYVACALSQALMAGLIMGDVIVDVGLIAGDSLSFVSKLATQALIQLALLATFLIGRLSRRSTIANIQRFETAVRDVAQREALLNEARQELERAAWVGGPGRFTEQELGSFKLGLIIGRGAMGEVYEGFNIETGTPAAVKLLHRNVLSDASQVLRFAREAKAVSVLNCKHVVRVFEVGDATSPIPYIAMERMVGDDLGTSLRNKRTLPTADVVELVRQVAIGIDSAAEAGIVHRDLKPQNLFFNRAQDGSGHWKILDFGVSKLADGTGTLTQGRVVGTPTYMAPEQARGKKVDTRADVYALAAIAYRALTGHPCFTGREVPQILYDVVHKMPRRPTRMSPELPAGVDAVLAIGLAKRPADRFATAGELANRLRQAVAGELPRQLIERADALLRKRPWGSSDRN